jgi:outer membrane protein OmpA-like peptidoglycan-associated protein
MKRFSVCLLTVALAVGAAAMTSGCAVALLGVGAGAATAAYVMGELTQTYESSHAAAVQASTDALGALEMAAVERSGDERQTTLKARRADGSPVEIGIERIDAKRTEIGVRTGHVGVWDQQDSRKILDMIGERLAPRAGREVASAKIDPPAAKPQPQNPALAGEPEPARRKAVSGTAAVAPRPAQRGGAGVNPQLTVFFASGTDAIAPGEAPKLGRIAAMLRDHPARVASLHGYSDSGGNASQNFILSVKRADAVKRYLVGEGCPADQVLVIGHGSVKFLGTNDTAAGRRLNRRVEIEIHNTP